MTRFETAAASPRESSEDRHLVMQVGDAWVIAVADGTGGISGGARAADLVIAGVRDSATQPGLDVASASAWTGLLLELDRSISAEARAGETTGVVLAVTSDLVIGASCGDSRAYLIDPAGAHELTRDQQRKPRLGSGRALPRPFAAGAAGTLLVASDGLFDYVSIAAIRDTVVRGGSGLASALVELVVARCRQLPDDIVVITGKVA
ncbi:MAG: hypothetical protein IT370_35960 [Deltaproteobacteria bacterium]|nr:hypothetical protein [Deltaproteobacteria bacterium]